NRLVEGGAVQAERAVDLCLEAERGQLGVVLADEAAQRLGDATRGGVTAECGAGYVFAAGSALGTQLRQRGVVRADQAQQAGLERARVGLQLEAGRLAGRGFGQVEGDPVDEVVDAVGAAGAA